MNNKKIKILLKNIFLNRNSLFYKNIYIKLKKVIFFSKKNLNFICYNNLFFFFKNLNLNDLSKILFIIKKFNIKIYKKIPSKKEYFENLKLNKKYNYIKEKISKYSDTFFKKKNVNIVDNLKKNININKKYIYIEKKLLKIFNIITKNFFIFKILLLKIKLNNNFYKKYIKNEFSDKKKFLKKIYTINKKKNIYKKEDFYNFFFFIKNIFIKKKIDNIKIYKNFFKKFKFQNNELIFSAELLDEFYKVLFFYYNKIENIKNKIYDILLNISNMKYIKYIFYFNKNGSNIDWILNIEKEKNFYIDNDFIKKYKKFIFFQKKKLKKIEKDIYMPLNLFIKIFSFIELNKFKIDIIKNNILENNLHLVNYFTFKYLNKDLYWDYYQEGVLGLIYSINKYKYKYKNFKNFVIFNIKSNINKFYYKGNKLINLPKLVISSMKLINEISDEYFKKFNNKPSIKYLEKKTKLSKKKIIKALKVYNDPVSLEEKINPNDLEETRYIDIIKDDRQISPEEYVYNNQLKININNILNKFDKKTRKIISMIYGLNGNKKSSYLEIKKKYNFNKKEIININNFFLKKIKDLNLKKI